VISEKIELFNAFFKKHLLPVQKRYGSQLVGRWQTEDKSQIIALWVYEDMKSYEDIQSKVKVDPDSIAAQKYRFSQLEPLFTETEESFMTSTVDLSKTELSHLIKK